jgi:hypothetical protein
MHMPAEHVVPSGAQSEPIRHWTQMPVVVSHHGVKSVPTQSLSVAHGATQTPAVPHIDRPSVVPQVLLVGVHVCTHEFAALQDGSGTGQSVSFRHCTQTWASHLGVGTEPFCVPVQSGSIRHSTHRSVFVSQTPIAQSPLDAHAVRQDVASAQLKPSEQAAGVPGSQSPAPSQEPAGVSSPPLQDAAPHVVPEG